MTLKCRMKFICTQGPMENTVRDFWHMIVQEGCRLILMLCNFREGLIFHYLSNFKEKASFSTG
ncbi:hypothetical protein COOONC_08409 [Cooperia oncophora]